MFKFHANSVKSSLKTSSQLSDLTIEKIDEWKVTDESFIIYWKNELRTCEDTFPRTEKWLDSMKIIMLENFVALCPHLKNVKDMSEQTKTHIRDTFPYDYYQ